MDIPSQLVLWGVIAMIALFVLVAIRELFCWYFKINESVENQRKIINLLEQQSTAPTSVPTPPSSPTPQQPKRTDDADPAFQLRSQ